MLQKRLIIEWILIFLVGCALAAFAIAYDWMRKLDTALLDQAVVMAAPAASDEIIIVEFDERSLREIGAWPWKRSVHANIISQISNTSPKVIGYDVLFVEQSDETSDQLLVDAVSSSRNVVLPLQFQTPGSDGREIDIIKPFLPLDTTVAGTGHVSAIFDSDGLVRHVELQKSNPAQPFPHMMETVGAKAGFAMRQTSSSSELTLLPLNKRHSFKAISAISVLKGELPAEFLKNKIVLVGATAQGLGDSFPVSAAAGSVMPGIELQANLLNGLLKNDFITEASRIWSFGLALCVICLFMAAFWRLSPKANMILFFTLMIILILGPMALALYGQIWIAPSSALLATVVLYPLWGWRRLAALNDFVSWETQNLIVENDTPSSKDEFGFDAIARQAVRLRSVIGELAARRDFVSGVIGAAPDAICVVTPQGEVIFSNEAANRLFGDKISNLDLPEIFLPDRGNLPLEGVEWLAPNGQTMLITSSNLNDRPAENAAIIYCFSNVTEIKKAEYERKEMLEFLSHDMRSPQASIISLIDTPNASQQFQADVLPRIRKHAQKTLKLTEDFVQLARLASVEPRFEELNIADLLQEAIEENFSLASQKSIKLRYEAPDALFYVSADGGILVRVFSNLLSNAIKYSPEGSEVLCSIAPSLDRKGSARKIRCIITDQGPGIPEERLNNLFGRFGYRNENATISAGLGLAFVKNGTEKNSGEISCKSSAKNGTCFELIFNLIA